jgi:hypothetical protein
MLALVGTGMSRSASGNVLLRDGDGVLGTHMWERSAPPETVIAAQTDIETSKEVGP